MKFGTGIMRSLATLICGALLMGPTVMGAKLLNATLIPVEDRTYNIKDNFCRLLAHGSLLLRDQRTGGLRIVIDGGMAKYEITWDGEIREVPDLNKHTVIIDLNNDFDLDRLPISVRDKPLNVPVLNRGIIWTDKDSGNIYIANGHFFEQAYWDESEFYIKAEDIPSYSIWKYDINADSWENINPSGADMIRLISSAYTSIPLMNKSFAFGGYMSSRSAPTTMPPNMSMATNGMVIYDHEKNEIVNITDPTDRNGYTHGALHHIPADGSDGMLLNLMALQGPLQTNFTENASDGAMRPNDFTQIRFFDLESDSWITQTANFFDNEKPETRTRFCSVLVRDEESKSWDLWVYGGQKADNPEDGANDIWVLTMPTFMWIKITNTIDNFELRGHTCHAVGNQLVVLGGYPPSFRVDPTEACDSRLMRVFDMTEKSWTSSFKKDSKYVQPQNVRNIAAVRKPLAGWDDDRLEKLFAMAISPTIDDPTPTPTPTPTDPPTSEGNDGGGVPIWAIVVIVVLGLILALVIWQIYKHRSYISQIIKHRSGQSNVPSEQKSGPSSNIGSGFTQHHPQMVEQTPPSSAFFPPGPSPAPHESSSMRRVADPMRYQEQSSSDYPLGQAGSAMNTVLHRSGDDDVDYRSPQDEEASPGGSREERMHIQPISLEIGR